MAEYNRNPFNYPLNPQFGQGIFRRRILLVQHEGYVAGDLEDCNHGFSVKVFHDGIQVTGIEGQHHRIPFSTCGGAREPLLKLVGMPLGLSSQEASSRVDIRGNCTHWLDLALLAIQHAPRSETVRQYDIEIADELDKPTLARLLRNGELILEWPVQDWVLQEPSPYAGNTLFKGFSAWANRAYTDEESKEAAFALQKGYFVSRARRFDVNALAGMLASKDTMMAGVCYTYSEPRASIAVRTENATRDFTNTPEELLKFR